MNQSLMLYRGNRALLGVLYLFLAVLLVGCGRETVPVEQNVALTSCDGENTVTVA